MEMSQSEYEFLKKLRTTIWTVFGLLIFSVIIATVPFYFNTQNELKNSKEKIEDLKTSKADRIEFNLTVKQIQKDIAEINDKLDKKNNK